MHSACSPRCLWLRPPPMRRSSPKYSGIQPIDHPSSYAEKYFGEEARHADQGHDQGRGLSTTPSSATRSPTCRAIRNGTIGFTTVSASNLNQVCRRWTCTRCRSCSRTSAFLVVPGAAAGGRTRQAAGRQGHQDHRLYRFRLAQLLHPEGHPHARRSEGPEDPRDGLAGDGQHHEGDGRDRRAGGLGRALHRAADRRGGRRGKQPSVRRRQEVLRGVEISTPSTSTCAFRT